MSSKLVLVLNCGSSSLKFAIIDAVNGEEYLSGLAECFHLPEARIKWKMDGGKQEAALGAGAAHSEALNFIVNTILAQKPELSAQLTAIGHRVVHGGEKYTGSVVIDDSVIQGIKDAASFAPLHNPAHLIGIAEALKSFPNLKDKKRGRIRHRVPSDYAGRILPLRPAVQPVQRTWRSSLRRARYQPLLRHSGSG
ncbi:Acetate kinase [Citrobacter freundii]|uniref:Acetate kinase n=1 Tax=Citrobacter freundii TaxID=546 RepID=A0A7G2IL96_CITFR|nr:Acetate kinase [Citrobacter freundii]